VHLNAQGRAEAARLAERLGAVSISALYASPRERALETAAPLTARLQLKTQVLEGFDEIDFGAWSGKTFADLAREPGWDVWVDRRSEARPPGGESISEAQRRAAGAIDRLLREHDGQTVVVVSHGDVIKSVIAHCLRLSLDELERFDVAPASVSVLAAGEGWTQLKLLNDTGGGLKT
jgi:probable phosphoglycerate mutase